MNTIIQDVKKQLRKDAGMLADSVVSGQEKRAEITNHCYLLQERSEIDIKHAALLFPVFFLLVERHFT